MPTPALGSSGTGVLVLVAVGVVVGESVGVEVGVLVGVLVGELVGESVGVAVGDSVGVAVGVLVGVAVGDSVGVEDGVGVVRLKVNKVHSLAAGSAAAGWLSGALGATVVFLSWYKRTAVKTATPANTTVASEITIVTGFFLIKFFICLQPSILFFVMNFCFNRELRYSIRNCVLIIYFIRS